MVIWRLPAATDEPPHGLKYRLFLSAPYDEILIHADIRDAA